MTTQTDRTVASFLLPGGGLSYRAIGCKFPGKKPGTWREVTRLVRNGKDIKYRDNAGAERWSWYSTFLSWIDRKAPVDTSGVHFKNDDLFHCTVRMLRKLRKRGYSVEDVITAWQEIAAEVEPSE